MKRPLALSVSHSTREQLQLRNTVDRLFDRRVRLWNRRHLEVRRSLAYYYEVLGNAGGEEMKRLQVILYADVSLAIGSTLPCASPCMVMVWVFNLSLCSCLGCRAQC